MKNRPTRRQIANRKARINAIVIGLSAAIVGPAMVAAFILTSLAN